jgi:hypothetical protein
MNLKSPKHDRSTLNLIFIQLYFMVRLLIFIVFAFMLIPILSSLTVIV